MSQPDFSILDDSYYIPQLLKQTPNPEQLVVGKRERNNVEESITIKRNRSLRKIT